MDATEARQTTDAVNADITSSMAWNYIAVKITNEANAGGSYIIDPLQGFDMYVPLDEQTKIYSTLIGEGYMVSDTNDDVPSGSFDGAPTKKISW